MDHERLLVRSRLKAALRERRVALGTIVASARNPDIILLIAAAGFDYVWLDQQHSAMSNEVVADMSLLARAVGVTPIVRTSSPLTDAERLLDVGAMGIVVPDVTTRQQVHQLRSVLDGRPNTLAATDFLEPGLAIDGEVIPERVLSIQIESEEGVENLETILTGGGVDIVQVGRNDLAQSLGVPRELRHPRVLDAVDVIVDCAGRHGATVAAGAYSTEDARDLLERGVRCFHYLSDTELLLRAYKTGVTMLRDCAASVRPARD